MKLQHRLTITARGLLGVLALGLLALLPASLLAQQDQAPRRRSPRVEFERFAVGVRLGYQITAQITEGKDEQTSTSTNPATKFTATSEPQQDNWGVGAGFQVNLLPRWGVTADVIAHSIRFKTGTRIERNRTATRPAQLLSNEFVVTEANHWDIPILVRYYLNGPRQRARPFISGGMGMRLVRNAKATREIGDLDRGESEFVEITPDVATERTMGLVGGLGFELIDDVNLKLSVEGRYMRWQDKTFEMGLANALRNHVEIVLGLSF